MSTYDVNKQTRSSAYHSFFTPLVGKVVTVYRGGPESKTGILLDVNSDYLTLAAQDNNNNNNNKNNNNNNNKNNNNNNNQDNQQQQYTIVYYNLRHVKSVTEDSMSNSTQNYVQNSMNSGIIPLFVKDKSFAGVMSKLKNKAVQINQGGPEKKQGTLLDVLGSQYIVLMTEDDGVVYFNIQHIKSICESNQGSNNGNQAFNNGNQAFNNGYQAFNNDMNDNMMLNQTPEYMKAKSFSQLFRNLSHKWVSVNTGGPEAVEGILVETKPDSFTLVQNQEVLRLQPFHVKSICLGPKGALKQNQQNDQQDDQQDDQQQDQQQDQQEAMVGMQATDGMDSRGSGGSNDSRRSRRSRHSNRDYREIPREQVLKTKDYRWKG
ncbi:spore coat protein [Bacillus songklensis]|uniref:Spore coat protein n=1 Tax=Bacillus songklensis TaxID=1069116 RepID=A0ABV8B1M9_9BACI